MIINPYAFGVSYDPDAQAFFTASGLTGSTNLTAINNLVVALKGFGIWTKMKAIYPMIGGTAALHKWNLKNPLDTNAAFRLVFAGGWSHTSTGAKPNGLNGFADTFLNPNNYGQNNFAFGCYLRTNSSQNGYMGAFDTHRTYLLPISGQYYAQINSTGFNSTAVTSTQRLHVITRTTSTTASTYINGSLLFNDNVVSDGKTNRNIYLGQLNNASVTQYNSDNEHAFSFISDGLTGTEIGNLTTLVTSYQTTLSRQV
jgi:hypothetical protein